jgi:hypothetical protein
LAGVAVDGKPDLRNGRIYVVCLASPVRPGPLPGFGWGAVAMEDFGFVFVPGIRCDLVVKLLGWIRLSGCLGQGRAGGECGGFVVVLAGDQAVVEAAEHAAGQVALGGGVPVAGMAAVVVVGAGAG